MTNKKTILITEDDEFLTQMYKIQLEAEGFIIEIALNGEDALKQIDAKQPDLLLLDLLLPAVDGFEVLEHIQKKKYKFPIVILTNLGQDVDKKKCMELGATDYLVKSQVDTKELVEKLKKYL